MSLFEPAWRKKKGEELYKYIRSLKPGKNKNQIIREIIEKDINSNIIFVSPYNNELYWAITCCDEPEYLASLL